MFAREIIFDIMKAHVKCNSMALKKRRNEWPLLPAIFYPMCVANGLCDFAEAGRFDRGRGTANALLSHFTR